MVTTSAAPSSPTPRIDRSANHWAPLPLCCIARPPVVRAEPQSRRRGPNRQTARGMIAPDASHRCGVRARHGEARRGGLGAATARYPREAVAASGLTGLFCPSDLGGSGLGFPAGMEVFEELGRGDAALAFSLSMHNAVAAAVAGCEDAGLRSRWGADLAAGRALGGFSLTEPQAGSDATAITTLAARVAATAGASPGARRGSRWPARPTSSWSSARRRPRPGTADIALLAVDAAAPGVSFPVRYRTAAAAFLPIGEMTLADAPGDAGRPARSGHARGPRRDRRRPLRHRRDRLRPARRGARPRPAATPATRQAFGAAAARPRHDAVRAGRRAHRPRGGPAALRPGGGPAGNAGRDGRRPRTRSGSARTRRCGRRSPAARRSGAYGWLEDTPLPRFISLAKMLQVVDGTAEIQRLVIGRELARMAAARG